MICEQGAHGCLLEVPAAFQVGLDIAAGHDMASPVDEEGGRYD